MAWKHRVKKAHKQTAIRQAKAETDLWCSRYVRIKAACDLDPVQRLGRCFTCGAVKDVKNMDSGHYKSRGSGGSSGLYFDVRAIRLQCKRCNGFEQGRPAEFRDGLVAQYGEAIVEHLEILHKVRVYSLNEILGLAIYFKGEVRDMIETQGVLPWWKTTKGKIV